MFCRLVPPCVGPAASTGLCLPVLVGCKLGQAVCAAEGSTGAVRAAYGGVPSGVLPALFGRCWRGSGSAPLPEMLGGSRCCHVFLLLAVLLHPLPLCCLSVLQVRSLFDVRRVCKGRLCVYSPPSMHASPLASLSQCVLQVRSW